MTLHYLVPESTSEFAEKFKALYESDDVIAISGSDQYEAEVKKLKSKIHEDTKLILFTSGTEGKVKMVQLSRANIEANTAAVIESLKFKTVKEQFLFLPLYYSFGLLGQLMPAQKLGIKTTFVLGMMGLRGVKLHGMLSAVGSQWDVLVKLLSSTGPFAEVTHIVSAGSRLSATTRTALNRIFPNATIFNNYGQTECSPRILCLGSDKPNFYSEDAGYPVKGLEIKLGDESELLVKGPQVMLGYLGDTKATKEKIVDGWLQTGDQATIAEDGRVTIHGRLDDLVKLGGERVSLLTFSQAALDLGLSKECLSLLYTDTAGIDRVALVLGLGKGMNRPTEPGVISRIKREMKGKSAIQMSPTAVVFLDELPKLANGKVDRATARKLLEEHLRAPKP